MVKKKINAVWLRATALFMLIVVLLTVISTFIGIYFGSQSIEHTVQEDLKFFSKMSSSMIETNIARLVTDCDYVSNKLDQSYLEGFSYMNAEGVTVHLPPGAEALQAAADAESKIGAQFFHLAAFLPEQNRWIEAAKDAGHEYALLDTTKTWEYKSRTRPFDPNDSLGSIVFGIPEQTSGGQAVLRAYTYRKSGLMYILTLSGKAYSAFVDESDLQLYGEGRITLLDESGYVFIATRLAEPETGLLAGQYYDRDSDPVFWGHVMQSIEHGMSYMDGSDAEKEVEFLEFKSADGNDVFLASAPIAVGNHCIAFITTVAADATPLADIRSIFYAFAIVFCALGLVAAMFFGYMQARPYEEILKLKNLAEYASRVKSDFLSNMSHEIRTPLNAVIGMAEIAQKSSDTARKDDCLNKISGSSKYLMGIINDILDMSKIEADKLELYSQPVSPLDILEKTRDIFFFRCQEKDITLDIDCSGLPRFIISDEQRILQVIANLVSNAVKFTPEGGSVSLSARMAEPPGGDGSVLAAFSVADTGIGMSEEVQENLFNAFRQADSSISAKYGGTGLGLAISKRIVELLGGDIAVKSRPGEGSVFTFTIRAAVCEAPEECRAAESAPEKLNYRGKTLLLAEDIPINREIVHALLEDTGIRILEAENGEEAAAVFERHAPEIDIVFMDLQMPVSDGYEATRKIRALDLERAKNVPIIAMTANVFRDDVEKCFAAGMNGHLGKPIDTAAMRSLLKEILAEN